MPHSSIPKWTRRAARRMRREPTEAERRLWQVLRAMRDKGYHWRRQAPIGNYVADFACMAAGLIIEVDGGQHATSAQDVRRDAWLRDEGYQVLRFWNSEVLGNLPGCLDTIASVLQLDGVQSMTTRIDHRFADLKRQARAGLVTFLTAGDPDPETSLKILRRLPEAGADVIEIGMPFSDPMADGPAIQASDLRALAAGQTLALTLQMVRDFRHTDDETPIVLMGYYNPIYSYGPERFLDEAKSVGVDGLIIVDLPPEADDELCLPALARGLNFIRLATPTTDDKRLPRVLSNTSGFVYYVSIAGITGTAAPDAAAVGKAVARIKRHTELPVAVGFGVRTPDQARAIASGADAVVVGSALVEAIRGSLDAAGRATDATTSAVTGLVSGLAEGVRQARAAAAE